MAPKKKILWLSLGVLSAVILLSIAYATIIITGGVENPVPVIPPEGPVLLATNQDVRAVTVVEVRTGRLVANIPVGDSPHEIAASPNGHWAVATLPGPFNILQTIRGAGGDKLAVIDVATATLRRTIDLGEDSSPHGVAFLRDNRTVVATSGPRQSVVLADIEAGVPLGVISAGSDARPHILAVSGDRQSVYSANLEGGTISEIDVATRTLRRTIPFPGEPVVIAVAPDGGSAWVIEADKDERYTLVVMDCATGAIVARFDGFEFPRRVGISPDGALALITVWGRDEIRIYDAPGRQELGRVSTGRGTGPSGVSFAPDSRLAYVALQSGEIAEIDLNARTIVRRFLTNKSGLDGVVYVHR